MSIYPAWRRDNNTVGQRIDPAFTFADGVSWDPFWAYTNIAVSFDVGDWNGGEFLKSYSYTNNINIPSTMQYYLGTGTAPSISTVDPKFGSGSIYYPGDSVGNKFGEGATTNQDDDDSLSFTFEGWFKPATTTKVQIVELDTFGTYNSIQCTLTNVPLGGNIVYDIFRTDGSGTSDVYGTILTSSNSVPANVWTHVAWVCETPLVTSSSIFRFSIYINGVRDSLVSANKAISTTYNNNAHKLFTYYNGYADSCRFTSFGRYRAAKFLPQKFQFALNPSNLTYSAQFKRYSSTGQFDGYYQFNKLLLNMNGSNGSTTFIDKSGWSNTVTAQGGAVITTSDFKFGTGSLNLTAASSRLVIDETTATNSGLQANSLTTSFYLCEDFTVEAWVYTSMSNNKLAVSTYANITEDVYMNETTAIFHFDGYVNGVAVNYGSQSLGSVSLSITGQSSGVALTSPGRFGYFWEINNSSGSYLQLIGAGLSVGTGEFTFEISVVLHNYGSPSSGSGPFISSSATNGQYGIVITCNKVSGGAYADFTVKIEGYTSGGVFESFTMGTINAPNIYTDWAAIAITRDSSNTVRLFYNGTLVSSYSNMTKPIDVSQYTISQPVNGVVPLGVDEFRFTRACRYTSNYSINTAAFPNHTGDPINAFVLKESTNVSCIIGTYDRVQNSNYIIANDLTVPANQWSHIAWSCIDGAFNMYINGQLAGNIANQISEVQLLRMIGGQNASGSIVNKYNGYIDDLRVTIGEGRYYGSSFSVPTSPSMEYPS